MSVVEIKCLCIECDACGCLCDNELWHTDSQGIKEIAGETGWIKLGGKDYCPDCWEFDEDNNIITGDFKKWNSETCEEIK